VSSPRPDDDAPLADPDAGAAVPNDMPAQDDGQAAERPVRDGPAQAEPRPPHPGAAGGG
jgi:hypothetical protein